MFNLSLAHHPPVLRRTPTIANRQNRENFWSESQPPRECLPSALCTVHRSSLSSLSSRQSLSAERHKSLSRLPSRKSESHPAPHWQNSACRKLSSLIDQLKVNTHTRFSVILKPRGSQDVQQASQPRSLVPRFFLEDQSLRHFVWRTA